MAWRIEFTREALKDISKLELKVVDRILNKLEEIKNKPYDHFQRLVGYDDFKLRVGDYRIIALLTHDKKIIIEKIGHRKNIYKKKMK